MIEIGAHPEGAVLPVRVRAGARRNAIRGQQNGALKVAVVPVAERGRANRAVIALLSQELGLRRSQIECLSGATSPQKRLLIRSLTPDELQRRLRAVTGEPSGGDGRVDVSPTSNNAPPPSPHS